MKTAKIICVAIMALGLIFSAVIIGRCSYEDYCYDREETPETQTNPLTAIIGLAVALPAGLAAYYIEGKEDANNDR